MDQAWIVVANRENMHRVAKHGVFGLNTKGILTKVKPGDGLVVYVKGEKKIGAVGRAVEPYYMDDQPLFEGGLFPDRIGVKIDLLPPEKEVEMWDVVDELSFVTNKLNWQAPLVGGIRRIPIEDFETFAKAAGASEK